jgi:HSP20 family protein
MTSTKQAPSSHSNETSTTQPASSLPSNVARSDLLATFEDWLSNLGIRIGDIPEIRVDLSENDTAYIVHADIPGANKEDIKVQLEGNRVSISVEKKKEVEQREGERIIYRERFHESSHRTFRVDEELNEDSAQAKYENGVLELTLPKKHVKTLKHVEIR